MTSRRATRATRAAAAVLAAAVALTAGTALGSARPVAGDSTSYRSLDGKYKCSVTTSPAGTHVQCASTAPDAIVCEPEFGVARMFTAEFYSDGRIINMCTAVYDFPAAVPVAPGQILDLESTVVVGGPAGGLYVFSKEGPSVAGASPLGVRAVGSGVLSGAGSALPALS